MILTTTCSVFTEKNTKVFAKNTQRFYTSICLLFLFIIQHQSFAQTQADSVFWQKTIHKKIDKFWVDNQQNMYVVVDENKIIKYNANADSVSSYTNISLGKITCLSVANSLKIVVLFAEINTIILLDNLMNEIGNINLQKTNILKVNCVANSFDNNIILFDEWSNTLKKIDNNGNLVIESNSFNLLFQQTFIPANIFDENGVIYLYNKQLGWKVLDNYFGFKTQYSKAFWSNVLVNKNELIGTVDNSFITYNLLNFTEQKQTFNNIFIKDYKQTIIKNNVLYLLNNDSLSLYKIVATH